MHTRVDFCPVSRQRPLRRPSIGQGLDCAIMVRVDTTGYISSQKDTLGEFQAYDLIYVLGHRVDSRAFATGPG